MVTRGFSGYDVANVLINVGEFEWVRTNESHMVLKWHPPEGHRDTDVRTVSVPRHDRLDTGTLRSIAEQAGAVDFDAFCRWIDRHR